MLALEVICEGALVLVLTKEGQRATLWISRL